MPAHPCIPSDLLHLQGNNKKKGGGRKASTWGQDDLEAELALVGLRVKQVSRRDPDRGQGRGWGRGQGRGRGRGRAWNERRIWFGPPLMHQLQTALALCLRQPASPLRPAGCRCPCRAQITGDGK